MSGWAGPRSSGTTGGIGSPRLSCPPSPPSTTPTATGFLVPLAPLDDAAGERLLRAYLGGADLDETTRAVILGRAQGNPFFLAELLHLLVDRGLLHRVGDAWRLDGDLPREMLPVGVQAVLAARIDGLGPVARALLR